MIDYHLVQSINAQDRTLVLANFGLPTRNSMVYWVTRDTSIGSYIACRGLQGSIREVLRRYTTVNGRQRPLHLYTHRSAEFRRLPVSSRLCIEIIGLDKHAIELMEWYMSHPETKICVRIIGSVTKEALEWFYDHKFTLVYYQLTPNVRNEHEVQIQVHSPDSHNRGYLHC